MVVLAGISRSLVSARSITGPGFFFWIEPVDWGGGWLDFSSRHSEVVGGEGGRV